MGESVSGVTFECDYPPEARQKAIIVDTLIHGDLTPQEIDEAVRRQPAAGGSLYFVDLPKLKAIHPDVVVTQDLCHVCDQRVRFGKGYKRTAFPAACNFLNAHTLEQVLQSIETVGGAIGRQSEARDIIDGLRRRIERIPTARRLRRDTDISNGRTPLSFLSGANKTA
jgi:iron complex transport system substrate-binding protein